MHFGISTHLYHAERLGREYLADIGGAGFEAVELYTTRSHFDYHDEAANGSLARRPAFSSCIPFTRRHSRATTAGGPPGHSQSRQPIAFGDPARWVR